MSAEEKARQGEAGRGRQEARNHEGPLRQRSRILPGKTV
jgi:hypothetical protein